MEPAARQRPDEPLLKSGCSTEALKPSVTSSIRTSALPNLLRDTSSLLSTTELVVATDIYFFVYEHDGGMETTLALYEGLTGVPYVRL